MSVLSNNGLTIPKYMVVEYLETSMSRGLLGKFPDNSAFDFDYVQSSIWSPLLPPPVKSLSDKECGLELSKKLSYEESDDDMGLLENTKNMAVAIKRKFKNALVDNVHKYHGMKRNRRHCFGYPSVASSYRLHSPSPTPKKAWEKVIKAACKHFKKKAKKKEVSNPNAQLDLSDYL